MLSSEDLEMLIVSKKREIEKEKMLLGITPPEDVLTAQGNNFFQAHENKENYQQIKLNKQVNCKENVTQIENQNKERGVLSDLQQHGSSAAEELDHKDKHEFEEQIAPDLERYIRRYIGIPAMLKAGEYSPNNPLVRAERAAGGDALLGLGEYERRRNTLRRYRQAQYRQYLDQQAKKNQEAKEQAEREQREREEKEKQREERERQLLLERDRYTPERRRASVSSVPISSALVQTTKVDTGVQVDGVTSPLSVAVQTDDIEFYQVSPSKLTQAERELSPRSVPSGPPGQLRPQGPPGPQEPSDRWDQKWDTCERRRSYGDFDERTSTLRRSNRDKLVSDLRHSYMPSIFDADAIQMRNLQAEKEAAARRQFYQQELKNQILEQQRIREERKSREKMLEQAEMRRLEEQLRMLRVAQEREINKQHDITTSMKDSSRKYESKRTELQREIDLEQQKILRAKSQPVTEHPKRFTNTSHSDTQRSKLPLYYPNEKSFQPLEKNKKPYSFNIPDNSVFSANYDVDSYLRKNLNFRDKIDLEIDNIGNNNNEKSKDVERNVIIEKALIHSPKDKLKDKEKFDDDSISIPILRHSSKSITNDNKTNLSEAMKRIDDKWKVPAVQKNILKSLPNEEGKNINILTQLGSIRRQLQLEQLKLDKMITKDDT